MRVCAIRRQAGPEAPGVLFSIGGPERLDDVLGQADYVVITLPACTAN
jgi:hypothetical protein